MQTFPDYLSIIPLKPRDKVPAVKWEAYQTRHATPDEISQWFAYSDRNVGVVTGAVSGVVVVDVDDPARIDTLGPLPHTPTVTIAKGLHLYFKHPGRHESNFKLPCGDVRGDGGYVVAPPSIHPNGTPYEWIVGLDVPFAELPASVLRYEKHELKASNDNKPTTEYGRSWFKDIEILAHMTEGMRNNLLNEVACKAGSLIASGHLNEAEAVSAMLEACQRNGLNDGVQATIRSGLNTGFKNPRHPVDAPIATVSPYAKLILSNLSDIVEKPISWLWRGVLAKGEISLIAGPAGLGKSTITQDIAARVTSGDYWPTSKERAPVGNVIILSLEDDPAARIKPRMIEAGADISRVKVIEGVLDAKSGDTFNLAQHIPLLAEAIETVGNVSLVLIDPVTAYMGALNSNELSAVRPVMTALKNLAVRYGTAILLVSHLNKNENGAAINRVQGSGAWVQAARAYYMVERDKSDPNRRLMSPAKVNNGRDDQGYAFHLESRKRPTGDDVQKAIWDGRVQSTTADQLLAENATDGSKLAEAIEFLQYHLGDGPVAYAEIKTRATKDGIAFATLYRARDKLGVVSVGSGSSITWSLRSQAILT